MTWLTWRQFRMQFVIAFAALAALAVVLLITGSQLAHLYNTTVANCTAQQDCPTATVAFNRQDGFLRAVLGLALLAVPALLGIFWGAPLIARDLETGTFRLAWTQSVTRTRWLVTRLAIVGLASVAFAGLMSWAVTWWFGPADKLQANRFNPGVFDERGIVAIGYAAFAFALGVTAGLLIRRTLPAMAVTLAGFIATRIVFAQWVRPHLMAPGHLSFPIDGSTANGFGSGGSVFTLVRGIPRATLQVQPPNLGNAWILSTEIVDKAGHAMTSQFLASACPDVVGRADSITSGHTPAPAAVHDQLLTCATKVGAVYHGLTTYQPANRYWAFQGIETAIFIVAALALTGFCFWWLRRRPG